MTDSELENKYKKREKCREEWIQAYSQCPINQRRLCLINTALSEINREIAEIEEKPVNLSKEVAMLIEKCRERIRIRNAEIDKAELENE
jgi:predicted transcriptional regulator